MSWFVELGGKSPNGFFNRNIEYECSDCSISTIIDNFRNARNNTDVYYCTYYYSDKEDRDNCFLYSDLYFDLDNDISSDEEYDKLKHKAKQSLCLLKQLFLLDDGDIKIYFSGNKGFHFIIPAQIFGITPDKNLNVMYKQIAVYVKGLLRNEYIDTSIYDRKRLFRMNNSINSKSGLYKVQMTESHLYDFNLDMIKEYASSPKVIKQNKIQYKSKCREALLSFYTKEQHAKMKKQASLNNNKKSFVLKEKQPLLPCAIKLLNSNAEKGYRNNTTVLIASSLLQAGYTYDESLDVLYSWNKTNIPPLPYNEIKLTLKSAKKMLESGRHYGCSSFKSMDACSNTCRIYK